MLCSYIKEIYKKQDSCELADAINDIASPSDGYAWSSAGVYCFWNPENNDILYIGLAVDLSQRFKQHNSIVSCDPKGCKGPEISEWFETHPQLGYSVLVKSSLSQPYCSSVNPATISEDIMNGSTSSYGQVSIERTEGLLLESCKIKHGTYPPWNKMGGSIVGSNKATKQHLSLIHI